MKTFTLGCVPFVNAIPLIAPFEEAGSDSPVSVTYEVPSKLPEMLANGSADAVLVSSFDALTTPGRKVAAGVCIGSEHAVESVRLFSKVPFSEIRTLALDQSSMTSNALAQIILAESFGAQPTTSVEAPDQSTMLVRHDACVLIGDKGMEASSDGLQVMDLGQAWLDLTGLPFVWAMWTGTDDFTPELVQHLLAPLIPWRTAKATGSVPTIWQDLAAKRVDWPLETVASYLLRTMSFAMGDAHEAGLRAYAKLLEKHGLARGGMQWPEFVHAANPAVTGA